MPSYYIDPRSFDPAKDQELVLRDAEHHHLAFVRRHRIGDQVLLNTGSGLLLEAEILSINKQESRLGIMQRIQIPSLPDYAIAFSLLKNQRDEYLVEKCTELGTRTFFPFISRFTIRKEGKSTIDRFEKVALSAIKQCDNPYLPKVNQVQKLQNCLSLIETSEYTPILCSERMPDRHIDSMDIESIKPCFLIGPEGGWSEDELQLFEQLGIGDYSISKLVLRAETAAIAAAAQWVGKSSFN